MSLQDGAISAGKHAADVAVTVGTSGGLIGYLSGTITPILMCLVAVATLFYWGLRIVGMKRERRMMWKACMSIFKKVKCND